MLRWYLDGVKDVVSHTSVMNYTLTNIYLHTVMLFHTKYMHMHVVGSPNCVIVCACERMSGKKEGFLCVCVCTLDQCASEDVCTLLINKGHALFRAAPPANAP